MLENLIWSLKIGIKVENGLEAWEQQENIILWVTRGRPVDCQEAPVNQFFSESPPWATWEQLVDW